MPSAPEHKTFPLADLKATGGKDSGRFEAIVSVFGNVDEGGDRMVPGAFERTLRPPPEGRGFPPIVWSHLWGVVPIGASMRAEEVEGVKTDHGEVAGLLIEGELLVEEHQTAREVYAAMRQKGGDGRPPLREFSFGYRPVKQDVVEEQIDDGEGGTVERTVRELSDVDLFEVGPTLVGMNPRTALLGVKSLAPAERAELARMIADAADLPTPGAKGATRFRETATAPADTAWDSAAEAGRADLDDLAAMAAYVDGDGSEKGHYKLLHHRSDSGHPVVWRGVRGAMRTLLAGDAVPAGPARRQVYDHLAAHYEQFDKEPPALRAYGADELKTMFEQVDPAALGELLAAGRRH